MHPAPRSLGSLPPDVMSDVREVLRPPPAPDFPPLPGARADGPVSVAVATTAADGAIVLAKRTHHRILVVLLESVTLVIEERNHQLEATEAIWLPPGDVAARLVPARAAQFLVLGAAWPGSAPNARRPVRDAAGRLRDLGLWLQMERNASFPGADTYRSCVLELMSREWQRLATDETGALEKRLRAFVLEHLDRPLTLDELARHLGMGRYHLCRKYREVTGLSPMHAVRAVRIEQARALIRDTSMPMRLIARQVGLRSEQHLSRLLRLHFDVGVKDIRQSRAPDEP
ncbi:MAG: helix-turn-helix transcriptional regulator [Polyangiaceae bacterium]|nr:helix-turn-helix transcriptional regulator [Polyangiaceae bacterium]